MKYTPNRQDDPYWCNYCNKYHPVIDMVTWCATKHEPNT